MRLKPAVIGERSPLTVPAWHAPGEPVGIDEAIAQTFEPFPIGGLWGKPWGTTWFRMRGEIPPEWAGQRVEVSINLAFSGSPGFQSEGTIWHRRNGVNEPTEWVPMRGIHPYNHEWIVAEPAAGGETFDILVEASANPSLIWHRPDRNSDIVTAGNTPIYSLAEAELHVVHGDVWNLREDIRVLQPLMRQLSWDDPRRHEILRAVERCLDVLVLDDVVGTAAAARGELFEVLSRPAVPSAHHISAIGHAHIDTAWLWPLRETRRKCARTFANVLSLSETYPELKFACSQAAQYEWMRESYPSIFEGIVEAVADGRWIPVGGMWVEADTNLAGGEALVRQFVHGQRFFREHFGVSCSEVWIPDVFGYPASLPQIMRIAGCDRFLTQKLSWNTTNRFPHHTFRWEGIDGSTVFTHFPPVDTYNASFAAHELAHVSRNFSEKGRASRSLMPFGLGDGGGGPNRTMLELYRRSRDLEGLPASTIESPEAFFDAAIAEYPDAPRWVGELYFEMHRGTFTSQASTKAGNRRCEMKLREAELWCLAAYGPSAEDGYPVEELDAIWKTVLLHQFHDILPGSSIGWVHREAAETYAELVVQLDGIIDAALSRVAAASATPVLLGSAAPHDRDEVVALPAGVVVGSDVQALPDGRVVARVRVPAMGTAPAAAIPVEHPVVVTDRSLDNGLVRVVIGDDGVMTSIVDLRAGVGTSAGRELLAAGGRGNLLQLHEDYPNAFDAWDIDDFYRNKVTDLTDVESIEATASGPVAGAITVTRAFRSSRIVQTIWLRAGSARVDVMNDVDWHERDQLLKAAFELDVHTEQLTREIQFGHLSTAIHTNTSWDNARFEVCAHKWAAVSEPGFGVALLNDAKYGYDATRIRAVDDATATSLRLTLLKGAQYPDPVADEGHHRFEYSLLPFSGSLAESEVVAEGYRLNLPVRSVMVPAGSGDSGGSGAAPIGSFVSSTHPAVVIESVKPAEDGSGDVVVRCYEAGGGRAVAAIQTATPIVAVTETNAHEVSDASLPSCSATLVDGHTISLSLRAFQIATLRLKPA